MRAVAKYVLFMVLCIISAATIHHWHVEAIKRKAEDQAKFAKYLGDNECRRQAEVIVVVSLITESEVVYRCRDGKLQTREELWKTVNPS